MSAQGEHEVARMTNWSQRVNKEIQGALDWYKEWGIIFQQENNAKPPSLDQLIRQKEAELRKCVCAIGSTSTLVFLVFLVLVLVVVVFALGLVLGLVVLVAIAPPAAAPKVQVLPVGCHCLSSILTWVCLRCRSMRLLCWQG